MLGQPVEIFAKRVCIATMPWDDRRLLDWRVRAACLIEELLDSRDGPDVRPPDLRAGCAITRVSTVTGATFCVGATFALGIQGNEADSKRRPKTRTMNILEATRDYEAWMGRCTPIVPGPLRDKHQQMRGDLFAFSRATFYRWAQQWPEVCEDLQNGPRVLAVGDLHVDSFGTWRDVEGRLCWGVDDFDEAYPLPYTNDLVRLAASAKIVIDAEQLAMKYKDACDAILEGYRRTLREGGCPIVLGEGDVTLERLGIGAIKPPEDFWPHLQALPAVREPLRTDVRRALERSLPDARLTYKVVRREAGIGSLGQPRFVAIASWKGGLIAREAKAMVPSACVWLDRRIRRGQSFSQRAIEGAVRSRDPFQSVSGTWLIRRLSPDANPIEIADLPRKRDEATLLHAMGTETANVHLGSPRQIKGVLVDLHRRKANWLRRAAKAMADATRHEWKTFRKTHH
jgi:hypothetical protein